MRWCVAVRYRLVCHGIAWCGVTWPAVGTIIICKHMPFYPFKDFLNVNAEEIISFGGRGPFEAGDVIQYV